MGMVPEQQYLFTVRNLHISCFISNIMGKLFLLHCIIISPYQCFCSGQKSASTLLHLFGLKKHTAAIFVVSMDALRIKSCCHIQDGHQQLTSLLVVILVVVVETH